MSVPISIIVPIYNMEKLIRKCLDSILAQSFKDYECLLIDDGSKDGSPAICDEYAQKDERVKVFHKPNGGLSDARNYGLARAYGEYTIFFDPDDWVDEDCLKDLYTKAQETDADMVICDYYNQDPYQIKYVKQEPTSLNHHDVLKDMIVGKLYGFTWNKLLKRDLYSRYNLQYTVGMYGCEDQYTMCKLLKNDIQIAYLPKAYYHYMHYGDATQSRRYDENTYQHDVRIRDMFVDLLSDTPYKQLAYEKKTLYMVHRAFHFGKKVFSAQSYKSEFEKYESLIKRENSYINFLLLLSIKGYYPIAKKTFNILYQIKQFLKKLNSKTSKVC